MSANAFLEQNEEVKTSYLVIMGAISTADHESTEGEVAFMDQMATVAGLSEESKAQVTDALKNTQNVNLKEHLSKFTDNELKYALVTDLLNISYKDGELETEEVQAITQINGVLGINDEQFAALQNYVKTANKEAEQMEGNALVSATGEPKEESGNFLEKTGLMGMFQSAKIPTNNFMNGSTVSTSLSSVAVAMLTKMMAGGGGQGQASGGGLGSMMGSVLGGLMGGGKSQGNTGGGVGGGMLGSLVSGMLQGGGGSSALGGLMSAFTKSTGHGKGMGSLVDILGGGNKKQGNAGLGNIIGSFLK